MYGIYGKKDIDDNLKKEVFGSKNEFDKIFNKDILFEKFRNIARALVELEKEGCLSALIKVKDYALERINNNEENLIEKCKEISKIEKIDFTLEELLGINLKMEEYFYNYSEWLKYKTNNSDIEVNLEYRELTFKGNSKNFFINYVDAIFILVAYFKYSTDLKKFKNDTYLKTREFNNEINAIEILEVFLKELNRHNNSSI